MANDPMDNDTMDLDAMTIEDRLQKVEEVYVKYPHSEGVLKNIKHCHQYSMISAEPECLLITGETGAGKTTLYRRYEQDHPRIETTTRTVIPVLSATIPAPATPKSLVTILLASMSDQLAMSGTAVTQTLRLYGLIKACEVRLIVLDEFQHLVDRDSKKVLQSAADWLKNLITATKVPIVLIGLPSCHKVLDENSQLRRRFAMRKSLDPFAWEHPDPETQKQKRTDFRRFLKVLEGQLPLKDCSHLADPTTAYRIHCATRGRVAGVVKLIRRGVALALLKGEEKLTTETLADAYSERLADEQPEIKNPFLQ